MSNNFEIAENQNDWKVLRTSCTCLDRSHIAEVEIEPDENFGVSVLFQYTVIPKDVIKYRDYIFNEKFLNRIIRIWWGKLIFICKIISGKPITWEEAFLFRGQEHIDEFCDYIKKASREMNSKEQL